MTLFLVQLKQIFGPSYCAIYYIVALSPTPMFLYNWQFYGTYSSVPNSSACMFINFEEKIHPAQSYLGLHFYLS